jgi:hypothetical protein
LAVKREKLLNLQKALENWRDRLWPAFKIGELAMAGFQKLMAQLREILSNRSKGLELADFKKLFANSKSFCVKRLRIN